MKKRNFQAFLLLSDSMLLTFYAILR
jgi:hypothetical protein